MLTPNARNALMLILTAALLVGCAKASDGNDDAGAPSGDTPTVETDAPAPTSTGSTTETATETQSNTTTVTETATVINTVTNTITAVQTVTATITATVTNTVTATQSSVSTVTVSSVQTVTATQTATVTVTEVATGTEIEQGHYESQTCFLNRAASEGMGQTIYTRATFTFGKKGEGSNQFELFGDDRCDRNLAKGNAKIKYTFTKRVGNLLVLAVEQYDSKTPEDISRYWIAALQQEDGLLFDIDYARGAAGPFLEEPSTEALNDALAHIGTRGVHFKKK